MSQCKYGLWLGGLAETVTVAEFQLVEYLDEDANRALILEGAQRGGNQPLLEYLQTRYRS